MSRQRSTTIDLSRINGWLVDSLAKSILVIAISKLAAIIQIMPNDNLSLVIMIILLILIPKSHR